jgi:hypothetical protein
MLSEDGLTLEKTHLATTTVYNPIKGGFLVGGLTNDTKTCIVSNSTTGSTDLNIWTKSATTSFNATNELQFMNSFNRTVVAKDVTTDLLYASNGYVSQSLFVTNNTNTYTLNATNVNSSNINTNNLTSQFISTNYLDVGQLKADYISTNYISSAHITTSSITVDTLTFANHLGNYANITSLSTVHAVASFFYGNGANISNVTANSLADIRGIGYNIPNTNIIASNITGNFTGHFTGTVTTTGPLSDDIINTNTLYASSITTYGNITMVGTNGTPGIITGNGSGLTNVTAKQLSNNINHNIGTGSFTARAFIGDGSGLTNLPNAASATTANYATTAGSATSATSATTATTATYARYALNGFSCGSPITAEGGFIAVDSTSRPFCTIGGNGIICTNNIQGTTITATGGFVGDGSRLTGLSSGNRFYRDTGYVIVMNPIQPGGTNLYMNLYNVTKPPKMFRLKLTVFMYQVGNDYNTGMIEYDILGGTGLGGNQINPPNLINTTTAYIPNGSPIVTITSSFPTPSHLILTFIPGTTNNVNVRFLMESIGTDIGSQITFSTSGF